VLCLLYSASPPCACLQGSDFSGSKLVGVQFARAQAQGAAMRGADLTDANCFGTSFDGADLEVRAAPFAAMCILKVYLVRRRKGADLKGHAVPVLLMYALLVLRIKRSTCTPAPQTAFVHDALQNAQFENAILSSASFGKYDGKWANLKGAHFEGALLSSSDVGRICENPTLDVITRKAELGCRGPAPR
jgi:uncharacterized protein YjbI with pentapeptide repeats